MKMKSSSKKLICFYLLLLLYFQSSSFSSCSSFVVSAFSQQLMPVESHGGFEANDDDDHGDEGEDFGDEKRKVYTGPNPLHNR
ncbi:hypothetical protein J1N35_012674 [Gossypium stocksii]|uniref:Uncharacterized protein n=1 Tax=Gossypium stocksii TaxID=47602 RepID=A0A9D3W502_9ROSI|nr:hypothetical protein J1N35_012674 [Gossypium stocksii]